MALVKETNGKINGHELPIIVWARLVCRVSRFTFRMEIDIGANLALYIN